MAICKLEHPSSHNTPTADQLYLAIHIGHLQRGLIMLQATTLLTVPSPMKPPGPCASGPGGLCALRAPPNSETQAGSKSLAQGQQGACWMRRRLHPSNHERKKRAVPVSKGQPFSLEA